MKPAKKIKSSEVAAIEDCKRRLRVQLSRGNYVEAAEILNTLGNQQRLLGLYEDALENHKQEVTICKTHNKSDRMGLGIAYRNIAEVYIDTKKGCKAIAAVKRYLELAREVENCVEEQRALITMGRANLLEAEDDEEDEDGKHNDARKTELLKNAEKWFRKAYSLLVNESAKFKLELPNEKEYMTMKCNNCQNLGVTLDMMGSPQALKWFRQAVDIGKEHGLVEYLQPCHAALCNLYLKAKEPKSALASAKEAVKAAVALGSVSQEIEAKILQARASFFDDEIEAGKKILKKLRKKIVGKQASAYAPYREELDTLLAPAIRLSRLLDQIFLCDKNNEKKLMQLHEYAADRYADLNVFSLAAENYLKAVKYAIKAGIEGRKLSSLYFSIAESYKDCDQYEEALEYYKKEMSLYDDSSIEKFKTQTHITQLVEKWKGGELAVENHKESIRLGKATQSQKRLATAYHNYAMYLKSIGDSDADSTLKKAQELSEGLSEDLVDSQDDILDDGSDEENEDVVDLDNLSSDGDSGEEDDDANLKNVAQTKRRIAKRKNEAGETPLHIAAKKGDLNGVRKCMKMGFSVNVRDTAGWTPLHEACNFGCIKVVKELLDKGARVNDRGGSECDGITPLHDALGNGHFDVADILLENGADVLARDKFKNFPIDQLIIWRGTLARDDFESVHEEYARIKYLIKEKMQQKGRPYTAEDEKKAAKKSQQRSKSPEFTLLRSSSSKACPIPVRIANDDFDPDNADEATKAYQSTMQSLARHTTRRRENKKKKSDKLDPPISPGPRDALIPSELDVHEDWMVPDSQIEVRPPVSKRIKSRKRDVIRDDDNEEEEELLQLSSSPPSQGSFRGGWSPSPTNMELSPPTQARFSPPSPPPLNRRRNYVEMEDDIMVVDEPSPPARQTRQSRLVSNSNSFSDEDDDQLGARRSVSSRQIFSPSPPLRHASEDEAIIMDTPSPVAQHRQSRRTTLPFSRRNVQTTISSFVTTIPSSSSTSNTSSSRGLTTTTTTGNGSTTAKRKREDSTNSAVKDVLRLKIRVLDKMLLVPVDVEHQFGSIEWLCEQASIRYKQSYGVKPNLSLSTMDGALLCVSDPINLVLGGGESSTIELNASVLSYDTPAVTTKFQAACTELGLTPRPAILTALKTSETTGVLNLSGLNLHGRPAQAVFRSLNDTSGSGQLKELILSECSLFDEDVEELGAVLDSLSGTLSNLDLSCNGISPQGVRTLCNRTSQGVFRLKELDLSLNPLGNRVASSFTKLADLFPNLGEIRTKACNLSGARFYAVLGIEEPQGEQGGVGLDVGREASFLDSVDLDLLRTFRRC